jgi:hypothetical protein
MTSAGGQGLPGDRRPRRLDRPGLLARPGWEAQRQLDRTPLELLFVLVLRRRDGCAGHRTLRPALDGDVDDPPCLSAQVLRRGLHLAAIVDCAWSQGVSAAEERPSKVRLDSRTAVRRITITSNEPM